MKIKIENMQSPSSGREIANQFIIYTEDGKYFQSYDSLIAFKPRNGDKIQLDKDTWKFSNTTSRYRSLFLGESTQRTLEKIRKGNYELVELNE